MLDGTAMTEAMLQASLLQQQVRQDPSMGTSIDGMSYDDSVIDLHNTILLQQALQSSSNSPPTNTLALDASNMLAFQDSTGQLWPANGLMPHLSVATQQLADLQLAQAPSTTSSPVIPTDEYVLRRASTTSNQDLTEWQDKARTERRKVQNRAAQRAYRERKEKALSEMKELLEQKECELQALHHDHEELKNKYEQLLASQRRGSNTSDANDVLQTADSRRWSHSSSEARA